VVSERNGNKKGAAFEGTERWLHSVKVPPVGKSNWGKKGKLQKLKKWKKKLKNSLYSDSNHEERLHNIGGRSPKKEKNAKGNHI